MKRKENFLIATLITVFVTIISFTIYSYQKNNEDLNSKNNLKISKYTITRADAQINSKSKKNVNNKKLKHENKIKINKPDIKKNKEDKNKYNKILYEEAIEEKPNMNKSLNNKIKKIDNIIQNKSNNTDNNKYVEKSFIIEETTSDETNDNNHNNNTVETIEPSQPEGESGFCVINSMKVPIVDTNAYEGYSYTTNVAYRYLPLNRYYAFESMTQIGKKIKKINIGDNVSIDGINYTVKDVAIIHYDDGISFYNSKEPEGYTFLQTCEYPGTYAFIRVILLK